MTNKEKKTEEFMKLCVKVRKWFKDRDIDFGYTDTNIGHFALYIQDMLAEKDKEFITILEGLKMEEMEWDIHRSVG